MCECPNTEFFLVRIFLYSVQIYENTHQKKLCIWTLFTSCMWFYWYHVLPESSAINYWDRPSLIKNIFSKTCTKNSIKIMWLKKLSKIGSSSRRCSVRKVVLKNFAKRTGKHLCQSLFFNNVADFTWMIQYLNKSGS